MIKGKHIKQWIESNIPDLKDRVYPGFTTKIDQTSVVYLISTPAGGEVSQDNLELRVISNDYDEAEEVKQQLIQIFNRETAAILDEIAFTGELSGGGFLYRDDLQMWELTIIFILHTKERI